MPLQWGAGSPSCEASASNARVPASQPSAALAGEGREVACALPRGWKASAGLVIATAYRRAVIAGALIALALVPVTALAGVGIAAGQLMLVLEALRRTGLDMLLVITLGGAVLLLKQHLVHRNRQPLI